MSTFEAISIQGIRSFDPNKAQVLDFLNPVTIILGQNGSGKTTIIESLKFATTGDLPPGSKVGGSFVHDPKLAHESEVKAKVSLEIRDINGNKLNVSRALKATQKDKNKQVSLQTLDSSIKRTATDGSVVSISSKCVDINSEMTNSLGVSKAVLENVIFCHQEESNWPLTEGKQVKERFDNLFATTRYVKALDVIRKLKMEKEASVKEYKTELKYLKINRDEAEKKISEKSVLASEVAILSASIKGINDKLIPMEESIAALQHQIDQFNKIEIELSSKINAKISNENRIKELEVNITEPLCFTEDQLKSMIDDSENQMERLKTEIDTTESQITKLKTDNSKLSNKNNSLRIENGGLATKIEAHNTRLDKFDKRLDQITSHLSIERNRASATFTLKNIKDYISGEDDLFKDKMKVCDEEIKSKQKILDDKVTERTKLEHDIEMNKATLKKKKLELSNLEKKIVSIGEGSNRIDLIEKDLSNLRDELADFKEGFDSKNAREKLKILSDDITKEEEKLYETDNALSEVLKLDSKFCEIKSFKQQIEDKSNEARKLRGRHSESLNIVFDNNVPKTDVKKLLSENLSEWRTKSHKSQISLQKLQSQHASLDVEITQLRSKIDEKKLLVKNFEDAVFRQCGNSEFNVSMTKLKKKKTDLEEEIATVQGNVSLYKKFQTILTKDGSDCPLCHREFCNESESAALISEITEKINFAPNLEKKSKELSEVNNVFEELLKLESHYEHINELRTSLIDKFENELKEKRNQICEIKSSIDEITTEFESTKRLESIGNTIQGDVALIEKLTSEVKEYEKKLSIVESQLSMSLEDFQERVKELRSEKKTMQNCLVTAKKTIDEERKSYENLINKENNIVAKINKLEQNRLEIQAGQQEWASLNSKREDLKLEASLTDTRIESNNAALIPIVSEVVTFRNDLQKLQEQKRKFEYSASEKRNKQLSEVKELETALAEIKSFEKECVEEALKTLEEKIMKNDADIKHNTECISEMEAAIGRCNSKIGNNKIKKREMVDTVAIRQCQSSILGLEEEIRVLSGTLGSTDKKVLQSQLINLNQERSTIQDELQGVHFRKIHAENKVKYIEQELTERYSNAGPIYMNMLTKMKVYSIAATDLEKFYKALDYAIMIHHKAKMAEINKILKELWRNTYSGKDIDYIEICSDEESSGTGLRRRNYNYRVVMVKSGVRLDLRGRCSAGQKVLASLLIRLALAEVFCLNCGILALDEPTTNLDRENIENLAFALMRIVKERSKQKNFQLILITHDEEFLQLLARSDYVDDFYKIHCNSAGHSQIQKTRIDHR